ncbi:MAG: SAM-dependent methyltransferase [Proteobacteria bacterium]|nr:SAM-dependent methyltransferase [Pseudomonadota bacterium]
MSMIRADSLPDLIRHEIHKRSGWMGFDQYMDMALYAPGLGYYSGPRSPFGAEGDFVTAAAISPSYGACVARQIVQVLDAIGSDDVLEFGAGDGRLAAQILDYARSINRPMHYQIIELSAGLRLLQQERLKAGSAEDFGQLRWLERLPEGGFRGVMLAHELLDAMPVRLFVYRHPDRHTHRHPDQQQWYERGLSNSAGHDGGGLCFADRPADAHWSAKLEALKRACQQTWPEDWPDGMLIEWHEQAQAWTRSVCDALEQGLLLVVDYGFPAHEYYLPRRQQGTLMTHQAHRAGTDLLANPGTQDLSVHVDFTAVARVALEQGMQLSGYCTQARFLFNTGILDIATASAAQEPHRTSPAALSRLAGLQKLLSEAEMGELFKFMALSRGLDSLDLIGFQQGDRSGRLGLDAC